MNRERLITKTKQSLRLATELMHKRLQNLKIAVGESVCTTHAQVQDLRVSKNKAKMICCNVSYG